MACKTISVCNDKGGVGKSVIARELAYGLARRNCKTLLIDLAPEAAQTAFIENASTAPNTIADVFAKQTPLINVALQVNPSLWFVAGSSDLEDIKIKWQGSIAKQYQLKKAIEATRDTYDYIIIDTQGSSDPLVISAIIAAQAVIVPMRLDSNNITVTANFLRETAELEDAVKTMPKIGIVVTHFEATSERQQTKLKQISKGWGHKVLPVIGRSRNVGEAVEAYKTLREFDPGNPRVAEYEQLFDEVQKWLNQP